MKNLIKITALFLVLVFTTSAFAQSTIGFRAGVNLGTMNEDPFAYADSNMDKEYTVGVDVALFSKINVAGIFSVQPELHWVQKGVKSTMTTSDDMDIEMTYQTDYLELPVLARVDLFNEDDVQFNCYLGPSVGYALNRKYIGENAALGTEDPFQKGDFKEDIEWDTEYGDDGTKDNRFDFSAVAGIGVTVETEVGNFVLDARYNIDFTDATNYENTPSPEPDKFYNRGISITAGFSFPITW